MNFLKYSLLVFISSCSFAQATELSSKEQSVMTQKADTIIRAMLDNEARENKPARVYKRLEGKQLGGMTAVIFTIEGFGGGNNYHFYMALFGPSSERFRFIDVVKIGEKTWRHVDFSSIVEKGDGIELNTFEYQGDDGNCCPSKKGNARFVLTDRDRLIEIEGASSRTK
jgi:hypothetical protein